MKGLAEMVMRGRFYALLVVVAGAGSMLFCWISAAVLALVTLRKGAGEGAWLMLWALLPTGAVLYLSGDSGPLGLLAGTWMLALVLRVSVNLPLALLAGVGVGMLTGLALVAWGDAFLARMVEFFGEFLANLEQQLAAGGEEEVRLARPTALQLAGMLGAANGMTAMACLLLARYWQAALYNPGGFGEEFRALRYPPAVSAGLALVGVVLAALGREYQTWAMICALPLCFAGLALVHARVAHRGQGTGWLVGFYLAWLFLDPVKLFVVLVAIADSWFDFRQRWQARKPPVERDDED